MAKIIKEIVIDCSKPNRFRTPIAKQGDMNSRFLRAIIAADGVPIVIECDSTVIINGIRSDGETKSFSGTVNEDGTVTVPVSNWMLEVEGPLDCEIVIINSKNQEKLSTTKFTVEVDSCISNFDGVSEDNNYDFLLELIAHVDTAIASCNSAAENTYIAADNTNRMSEELNKFLLQLQSDKESGAFRGEKGDKGDQGIQGPKGDKGEQGIQGEKGDNGRDGKDAPDDYTLLKNIPIRLIDLAEFKDRRFNFDEQITEPGLYKCVSSGDVGIIDMYIRENDAEPIGRLTAMDFFNVLNVNDNTTDGYQATLIFLSSERFIYFLNLSSHSSERSTCFQYPFINDDMLNTDRLSTFSGAYIMEILLDMSQNESENMDSIRQQLMLLIEQQQSKTEQKFTDVSKSIAALSESVNQEYLSRVDIEDVRIYTDENGNNKFQFDNATLAVTATGGNSYISDYIPITEKLRITGYAVQNTTMANGIAFVTYDSDKQPIQAYRGDTEISTFVYEKTAVVTPEEAAYVRIRSRDNYNSRVKSKATVERFVGVKEKIEEMQAQIDSLLGLTAAAYAAEE